MNWYQMFYWLSVMDRVSDFTKTVAISSLVVGIIGFLVMVLNDDDDRASLIGKRMLLTCAPITIAAWLLFVFLPSKKDLVLIIAGGAVGQFVEGNKDAKAIPAEVMTLLRTKIKSEINSVSLNDVMNKAMAAPEDTLKTKTKQQLIDLVKQKNALIEQ